MPKIKRGAALDFGPRLAELRKAAGFTQTAFAAEIDVSQRMMAYYESPTAHPPANLLPRIAQALGVSMETLLGTETAKRRAKPSDTRLQRRLQQLEKLPPEERRQVLQVLDAFIARGPLKRKTRGQPA
jgi:transcriptional regulator with XRE-family HTH domain